MGRGAREVAALPEEELPTRAPRGDGPPLPRAWAEKDPVAARRLATARDAVTAVSDEIEVPAENILTPDHLRRLLWTPPATRDPEPLAAAVDAQLDRLRRTGLAARADGAAAGHGDHRRRDRARGRADHGAGRSLRARREA